MHLDRRLFITAAAAATAPSASAQPDLAATLQAQTQALVDAVTSGQAEVWRRLLHENCVYTSESGDISTKAEMVAQVRGLPAGITGELRIIEFQARREGNVAIANYVVDEHETYHGAPLHCQYRNTDTWVSTREGWRLLAAQALALRTDPSSISLTAPQWDEYVGHYRLSDDTFFDIRRTADGVEGQQTGGGARPFKAEVHDVLFNPGRPRYRFLFMRDANGRIDSMIERREAWDMVFTRVAS